MENNTVVKKPFVVCHWLDAEDFTESGWASEETLDEFNKKDCDVYTYGYVVSKTKKHITICSDLAIPATWGRPIKIPRKMIISMTEVDLIPKTPKPPPVEKEP